MLLHALFLVGKNGNIILDKHWREGVHRQLIDQLFSHVQSAPRSTDLPPVLSTPSHTLLYVVRGEVYIIGAVGHELSPLLLFEFLSRVGELLELYLRELSEESLRQNFITVYQLLDEMIDNGAPLHMEPNVLQELVLPPSEMKSMVAAVTGSSQVSAALPEGTMSDAPWRRVGVRYAADELYIDLMERIDAVVDANTGMLRTAEVWGEALCKCQLSGRPELSLTFVNPHILEDVAFHQCVRLPRWERDQCISFVPPDGKFSLFEYHVRGISALPIYVNPNVTFAPAAGEGACSEGRLSVMVGAKHTDGKPIEDVTVKIPLPEHTAGATFSTSSGTAVYDASSKECVWTIGRLSKEGSSPSLNGNVTLNPGRAGRDIGICCFATFKVKTFASSGLKVASLRLEREEYQPYKGVRSITYAGRVEVRT